MNNLIINEVYNHYDLPGDLVKIEPMGNGLINKTYEIVHDNHGEKVSYVLQQINHSIFPNVQGLMDNIVKVTSFLKEQIKARNGDVDRETLTVVFTKEGHSYVKASDQTYWRIYPFIKDTIVLDKVENEDQFYETGRSFGAFQASLSTFDASELVEVIEKFHDTRHRLNQLKDAIKEDRVNRVKDVTKEIDFILQRENECFYLYDKLDAKEFPLRVTHNDTKLNNILLDKNTGKGICIVDLDTIMPGLSIFDFGDSIRYGANHCAEDESDMSKVQFDLHLFEVYAKGFIEGTNGKLMDIEIDHLPWGAKIITLEQGIRFLTDYINGDVYYGISREHQNLDRTRTQLKLVSDMEDQWLKMNEIIQKLK